MIIFFGANPFKLDYLKQKLAKLFSYRVCVCTCKKNNKGAYLIIIDWEHKSQSRKATTLLLGTTTAENASCDSLPNATCPQSNDPPERRAKREETNGRTLEAS